MLSSVIGSLYPVSKIVDLLQAIIALTCSMTFEVAQFLSGCFSTLKYCTCRMEVLVGGLCNDLLQGLY